MKKRDLVKRIADSARDRDVEWELVRRGANHDVYRLGGSIIPVPRHNEIQERTAEGILKECQSVLGEKWWQGK
ncbi:MAG: hypothetical protein LBI99_00605 [Propionibacteriaceae bacterium]|nr:hypothetical protein [Propionibacteriaceae bacterium]